jgi:two-component system chemotaxis response regulator CheY
MRVVLRNILSDVGFEVYEAEHGIEALKVLEEIGVAELALVDWNMPEMDGYDFICAVRANRSYDDMIMMMVTTETEMGQVAKALDAGADEYVMKPFTKEVILEKLGTLGLS